LKMQEYRYRVLMLVSHFFEVFGVHRTLRAEVPIQAGEYDDALHVDHPEAPSLLEQYIENLPKHEPKLGGKPQQTAEPTPLDG
jgi:hypothetical protein